jgi:hypothetical protein
MDLSPWRRQNIGPTKARTFLTLPQNARLNVHQRLFVKHAERGYTVARELSRACPQFWWKCRELNAIHTIAALINYRLVEY